MGFIVAACVTNQPVDIVHLSVHLGIPGLFRRFGESVSSLVDKGGSLKKAQARQLGLFRRRTTRGTAEQVGTDQT